VTSRVHPALAGLLAFLLALGAIAASAAACGGGGGGGKESTSLSTSLSGESKEGGEITVLEGAKVKDKATLSGKNVSKATGKVKYDVYSEKECKTLVTAAGEGTVSGESVTASSEESLEAGKTYYWQATYEGNESNDSSTSSCGGEVLNVKAATSLSTTLSGESKEGTEITVLEGSKVKDKATLSGTNHSSAGGKVTYRVYSNSGCTTLVKEAGEVTVSSGSVPASSEEELESGKTYYWKATYGGDSLHEESNSGCGEISTVKAKTTLTTKLAGEGKEGEEITVLEGSKIADKATLAGTNHSTAGGKVTYDVYSNSGCTTLVKEAGEVTVSSGSVPSSSEEELEGGKTYYWKASYGGDSLHEESNSGCSEISTVKAKTSLSTTLAGESKEGSEITVLEGSKAKDKATLGGTNHSTAGGKVTYDVYSDSKCEDLVTSAGEETVSSGSVPASSEEELEAGKTYYWKASYNGDSLHEESNSGCSEILNVKAKTTLTTTLSGESKEDTEITVIEGSKVTDNATLSGTNHATATGKVTYDVYSDSKCEHLVTEAGEVTVNSGSVPASSEEELEGGRAYYWQVTYEGDSLHQESTSTCGAETLDVKAKTSLSTELSSDGEQGEELATTEGENAKDTATLSGTNSSTATGTVRYDVYSDSECTTLVTEAGEAILESGAKIPASDEEKLEAGHVYYWQATYSGDSVHQESTTECGEEYLAVCACEAEGFAEPGWVGRGPFAAFTSESQAQLRRYVSAPAISSATRPVQLKNDAVLTKEIEVLTGSGIRPARAAEAIRTQDAVAEAGLVRKLQAAMGSKYAGLWFDNATAQLHVGITSASSRSVAEQTVARVGLSTIVAYTNVHATMKELYAIQKQWMARLSALPAAEDAKTGLQPQHNRVVVTLDESLPARQRGSLIKDAESSQDLVALTVVPGRGAHVTPQAKECGKFVAGKANCNPSITAGVTIETVSHETGKGKGESHNNTTLDNFEEATLAGVRPGDKVAGPGIPVHTYVIELPTKKSVTISNAATKGEVAEFTFSTFSSCSAGPQAIPTAKKAERVLLTAGHCIEEGHGVGEKWFAYKTDGTKVQLGTAIAYKNGGAAGAKIGDYGDITIEAAWQTGKPAIPVLAVTARWEKKKELRYPIVGERVPVEGGVNCHEGEGSGGKCGAITMLNDSFTVRGKTKEGLVEDSAANAPGDSGGDWFATNAKGQVEVEGTHVGGNATVSDYQPLTKPEATSPQGSLEALNLELLTTKNEACK
jgi:predicted  nucleic acid-binding Zn ribbon protein